MKKMKKILSKLITYFDKEEDSCPIGLKSLGLRVEYLNSIYKNKFSTHLFNGTVISPVSQKPLYFGNN